MYKCIAIHGIKLNDELLFPVKDKENENEINFVFMPYDKFLKHPDIKLINPDDVSKCDTVAVYNTMSHNSWEVYYIKLFLSIIFFSLRISSEELRFKNNIKDDLENHIKLLKIEDNDKLKEEIKQNLIESYKNHQHYFFDNYFNDG